MIATGLLLGLSFASGAMAERLPGFVPARPVVNHWPVYHPRHISIELIRSSWSGRCWWSEDIPALNRRPSRARFRPARPIIFIDQRPLNQAADPHSIHSTSPILACSTAAEHPVRADTFIRPFPALQVHVP